MAACSLFFFPLKNLGLPKITGTLNFLFNINFFKKQKKERGKSVSIGQRLVALTKREDTNEDNESEVDHNAGAYTQEDNPQEGGQRRQHEASAPERKKEKKTKKRFDWEARRIAFIPL